MIFHSVNYKIRDEFLKITQEEEQGVKEYYKGAKESRKACLAAERMKYKKTKIRGDQIVSAYQDTFHEKFEELAKDVIREYESNNKTNLEPFMLEFVAEWLYDFYLDDEENFVIKQIESLQKNNKIEDLLDEFIKKETENMKKWLSKEHYVLRIDTGLPVKTAEEMEQLKLDLTLNLSSVQNIFEDQLRNKFEKYIAYELINTYIYYYVDKYIQEYLDKNYNGKLPYSEYAILEALNSKTIENVNKAIKYLCGTLKNKKVEPKIIEKIENNVEIIIKSKTFIEDILEKIEYSDAISAISGYVETMADVKKYIKEKYFDISSEGKKSRKNLASEIASKIYDEKCGNNYVFEFLKRNVQKYWLKEDFWHHRSTKLSYDQWHKSLLPQRLIANFASSLLLKMQVKFCDEQKMELLTKDNNQLEEILNSFLSKEIKYKINLLTRLHDQAWDIKHFGSTFDEEKKTKQYFKMPETLTYLELVDFVIDFVINISIENLSEENVPENIINQIKEIVKNLKKEKNITSKTNKENSSCEIT